MPRACRYFLPGHVWHITHRCHKKEFLLKFARDRRAWVRWLFEAKKRYGLCILNYMATSNHIHLLVQDGGRGEIAQSMQLVAGRVAQGFNQSLLLTIIRRVVPDASYYYSPAFPGSVVPPLCRLSA